MIGARVTAGKVIGAEMAAVRTTARNAEAFSI
jgi:hypothetical protein